VHSSSSLGGGLFATLYAGMHWQKAAIRGLLDRELERGSDVATE
jgi:hypothetical protein